MNLPTQQTLFEDTQANSFLAHPLFVTDAKLEAQSDAHSQSPSEHFGQASNLIETLKRKTYSVGFVESCTGGKISAAMSEIPGVSNCFKGSVISYSEEVKQNVVKVPKEILEKEGVVSEAVALKMAEGGRRLLNVDCVAAVTGYAGPVGGTENAPVGTVCFAVMGPGFERTTRKLFSGNRVEIQAQAVRFAFEFLISNLNLKMN